MTKKDNCNLAYDYYAQKQYPKALESLKRCYKDIRKLSKKIKSDSQLFTDLVSHEISLGILESNIYIELSQYAKAQSALAKVKKLIDNNITDSKIAEGLRGRVTFIMGMIAFKKSEVEIGMNLLDKSYQHFLQSKDSTLAIDPLLRLAENSRMLGATAKADNYYKELEQIGKKVKDKKRKHAVIGQSFLGRAKLANDEKNSVKLYNKSLKFFTKAKHISGMLQAKMGLASVLLDQDKLDEGEELLLSILAVAQQEQIDYIVSEVYYTLGIISLRRGDTDSGRQRILSGLESKSQEGDTVSAANALLELANLNLMQQSDDKLQEAQKLATKSLKIFSMLRNTFGMAQAHRTLGSVFAVQGQLSSAFTQLNSAKDYFKKLGNTIEEARVLLQLADIRLEENNLQEVQAFLNKVAKISNTVHDPTLQTEFYQRQAVFYGAIVQSSNKSLVDALLRDLNIQSKSELTLLIQSALTKIREIYLHDFPLPQQQQLLLKLNELEQQLIS